MPVCADSYASSRMNEPLMKMRDLFVGLNYCVSFFVLQADMLCQILKTLLEIERCFNLLNLNTNGN